MSQQGETRRRSRRKKEATVKRLAISAAAFLISGALIAFAFTKDAHCEWCIATFCGTSAECPGRCVCAIPQGSATGHCMGIR